MPAREHSSVGRTKEARPDLVFEAADLTASVAAARSAAARRRDRNAALGHGEKRSELSQFHRRMISPGE